MAPHPETAAMAPHPEMQFVDLNWMIDNRTVASSSCLLLVSYFCRMQLLQTDTFQDFPSD
jgi:hypothetical protein